MEMPKRPKWNYKMDKLQLELNEEQYFRDYLAHFHAQNASQMLQDRLACFTFGFFVDQLSIAHCHIIPSGIAYL